MELTDLKVDEVKKELKKDIDGVKKNIDGVKKDIGGVKKDMGDVNKKLYAIMELLSKKT